MVFLAFLTPTLQDVALLFASHEFALLAIFGVTICGTLTTEGSPLKGWIADFFDLALSCVGYEERFSVPRVTYNNVALYAGIAFVPAMIGLFGLPNIFENLSKGTSAESADVSGEKKIKIGILSMVRTNLGTSAAPACWARATGGALIPLLRLAIPTHLRPARVQTLHGGVSAAGQLPDAFFRLGHLPGGPSRCGCPSSSSCPWSACCPSSGPTR